MKRFFAFLSSIDGLDLGGMAAFVNSSVAKRATLSRGPYEYQ